MTSRSGARRAAWVRYRESVASTGGVSSANTSNAALEPVNPVRYRTLTRIADQQRVRRQRSGAPRGGPALGLMSRSVTVLARLMPHDDWLPRGLVFAIGMVLLRLAGIADQRLPTNAGTISFALCALFGLAALIWGLIDGMADAWPTPTRTVAATRHALAARGSGGGRASAVWSPGIISLVYHAVYVDGLGPELVVFRRSPPC